MQRDGCSSNNSGSRCSAAAGDGEEDAGDDSFNSSKTAAAAAFWRWRLARCKSRFRGQLRQLLQHVAAEEQAAEALQWGVKRAQAE